METNKYEEVLKLTADFGANDIVGVIDAILKQHNLAVTTAHTVQIVPVPVKETN